MKRTKLQRNTPLRPTQLRGKKHKRTKATDIPTAVKKAVWERDGGRCIFCGERYLAFPDSHYIRRSRGGLGIEQNIYTACRFHHDLYDFGTKEERDELHARARLYLSTYYADWDESKLVYRKD